MLWPALLRQQAGGLSDCSSRVLYLNELHSFVHYSQPRSKLS